MDVNNKQDAMHLGQDLQRFISKFISKSWQILKRLFKLTVSFSVKKGRDTYLKHRDGFKAVQKDGSTKQVQNISGLSYEEMEYVLSNAEKNGIYVTAYEWKTEDNQEDKEHFQKGTSIAKQRKIIKHNQKIEKINMIKARHPKRYQLRHKHYDKELEKHKNQREEAIESRKGNKYRVAFNASRASWAADIIAHIKNQRLGIMDDLQNQDEKTKVAVDFIKEHGFDMNISEIKEFAQDFMANGTIDISHFENNYFVHSVDKNEYERISTILKENNMVFGVDENEVIIDEKSDNEKGTDKHSSDTYSIYFSCEDIKDYIEKCGISNGTINAYGDKTVTGIFSKEIESQREIIVPTSSINLYSEKLMGADYKMKIVNDKETILSINPKQLNKVYEFEKKNNTAEDEYEYERRAKAKNDPSSTKIEEYDSLFQKAAHDIFKDGNVTTVSLQRKLNISFARSKDLMKQLEEYGVIKPNDDKNTYDILMDKKEFDQKYKQDNQKSEKEAKEKEPNQKLEDIIEAVVDRLNEKISDDKEKEIGDDE